MTLTLCRQALRAALLGALLPLSLVGAASADPRDASDGAVRAIGRESSGLDAKAFARVSLISNGLRPRARDGAGVSVATRSVDGGTVQELSELTTARKSVALDLHSLRSVPRPARNADLECLAQAIYFESRGEPLAGQIAVAEVVLNRVDDRRFPRTVCGVTNQGVGSGRGCQFSYACDGNSDAMKSAASREHCEKLAAMMLAGRARTVTNGATYFHTRSIRPVWSHRMTRTAAIGHHLFYRVAGG